MMKRPGLFRKARLPSGADCFVAADSVSEAMTREIAADKPVMLKIVRSRNPAHHAMAWKVFDTIGEAIGVPGEAVLLWLKQRTGRCDYFEMPNGDRIVHPHSINFAHMDQRQFAAFWNDCWAILVEEIIPSLPNDVYDRIFEITADKRHGEAPIYVRR